MKLLTPVFFAALCAPATIIAQESTKENATVKPPSFIIGANFGLAQSYEHNYDLSTVKPTMGLFARYYLGRHFALESGIKFSSYGPRSVRDHYLGNGV